MPTHDKPGTGFPSWGSGKWGSGKWDSGSQLLTWLTTCVSVMSFLFYSKSGEVMLYGDAVAHINIARRVFDSKTPGLLQLGTVWLPLPHLLMIPFLLSHDWWQRGAGGSIPSMAAYVFAVVGIFRLTRFALSRTAHPDAAARIAAWTATIVFAANPNLIYMQSTAMGEVVYLAFFIWAVVFFAEAARDPKALIKCGLCLFAACFTRYDGWFLAAAMACIAVAQVLFRETSQVTNVQISTSQTLTSQKARSPKTASQKTVSQKANQPSGATRAILVKFVLLAGAAPALWLAYNGIVYRNPLEFENGPYSAKAIEQRTQRTQSAGSTGNPSHPGSRNLFLAGQYFLKSAEDNLAENEWLQRGWVCIALAAVIACFFSRKLQPGNSADASPQSAWPLLFLLIPLPFYALSVAYGGVPIFVPTWWPFSHYNVRYGLQLLPAFSIALSIPVYFAAGSDSWNRRLRVASAIIPFALVIASYASIWRATPVCLREAQINMRTRNQLEAQLASWLERLPSDSTILMYLGDHVGAVERAGIPLSHTINEGNHRMWRQPVDSQGLWERALANPKQYADYVVAFEGDPVWQAVHDVPLLGIVELHVTGQARAVLYRAR